MKKLIGNSKCQKIGDCVMKAVDGSCIYTKPCEYKPQFLRSDSAEKYNSQNKALKSPVSDCLK